MNEYLYDDLYVGQEESFVTKITTQKEDDFRKITGDNNPLHIDDNFAKERGKFSSHISFGMLSAAYLSTLAGMYLPGEYSLIHSIDNISFRNPVYAGDTLKVTGKIVDKQDGLNLIIVKVRMKNQNGKTVLTTDMKIIVQK